MFKGNFWTAGTVTEQHDSLRARRKGYRRQVSFQMRPVEQAEVLKNHNVGNSSIPHSLTESPKPTENIRLKPGGDAVSQHKIQMIAYFANIVGLGFNFVGTFLLLKYSPESKITDGWTVTTNFEKELIPAFEDFIKKAHGSIIFLSIGFALQFVAAILL